MTRKYKARQDFCISGWECGTEIELKMVIEFTVTDYRRQTLESPEEPRMVEDIAIRLFETDGTAEMIVPKWMDAKLQKDEDFRTWLLGEATYQDDMAAEQAAEARYEAFREDRI